MYGNWRHHAEGIRLCEAIIHNDVKDMFKEWLLVMAAAQIDTGVKDLQIVYTKICNIFNDTSWQPQCSYQLALQNGKARPETYHTVPLDVEKLTEKLREMRKVCSKALANLSKSGKHNMACNEEILWFSSNKPPWQHLVGCVLDDHAGEGGAIQEDHAHTL